MTEPAPFTLGGLPLQQPRWFFAAPYSRNLHVTVGETFKACDRSAADMMATTTTPPGSPASDGQRGL